MAVTAALIKELRELSGAGMSACKEALVETDGNIEKAMEYLREKGLSTAAKKAGRIASEGLAFAKISEDGKTGVVVEVNSETDFVAKNQEFRNYVDQVANQALKSNSTDMDSFFEEKWLEDEFVTVKDVLTQKIAVIGENLSIRRFDKVTKSENGVVVSYLHGAGKVAVLIDLNTDVVNDAVIEAGKNVAMQVAAMNPQFVSKDDVSAEFIAKEKDILMQQAKNDPKNANKPENIIEKMIEGRLNKELKEFCLVEQEYVKDDKMSVKQYLESVAKETGSAITIKGFVRYETGEGLAKKEENFADEVAKMI